ncbi:MAG: hypothetical protein JXN61_04310 [Sedimentisphaerales bacterium]|nr:hypothetical protein [Sedimentisphaerales bacterium]
MRALPCSAFIVLAAAACVCRAVAPTPALMPAPGQWTIDTKFTHPQQIILRTGIDNKPKRFWYSLITLTNKTGTKVDFYPKCELKTDTFQIIPAGQNVTPDVFESVRNRHQAAYSFLESLAATDDKILAGEDNSKDIAVIWPDFDEKAKEIKIYITGLSNETAFVSHPVAKDKNGNPLIVFLRKTLELTYKLEGDPAQRSDANLIYESQRWVMR